MASAETPTGNDEQPDEAADPRTAETDQTTEVIVLLHGYGHKGKVTRSHLLTLSRLLYVAFKTEAEIIFNGKRIRYDNLADDGHHPGHDVVLTEEAVG